MKYFLHFLRVAYEGQDFGTNAFTIEEPFAVVDLVPFSSASSMPWRLPLDVLDPAFDPRSVVFGSYEGIPYHRALAPRGTTVKLSSLHQDNAAAGPFGRGIGALLVITNSIDPPPFSYEL